MPPEVYLRPLTIEDANDVYVSWLNDPIVTKYLETKSSTMEQLREYVAKHLRRTDCVLLGIFVRPTDTFIGTVKIHDIVRSSGEAQFGMMIGDREYWGKGVGTLVTSLAARYAFRDLDLSRLKLGVMVENEAAVRAWWDTVPDRVNRAGRSGIISA